MSSLKSSGGGGEAGRAAVDAAVASLADGLDDLDGRGLASRLGDVEQAIRKLEAVASSIVSAADRREVFRDDGHVAVRG